MPTRFDDVDAKCPFYLSSGKRKISCEGITDGCTISLTFVSQQKRDLHRRVFCDARFRYCEIYNMLEEKYED